jgi:hypothetical protein
VLLSQPKHLHKITSLLTDVFKVYTRRRKKVKENAKRDTGHGSKSQKKTGKYESLGECKQNLKVPLNKFNHHPFFFARILSLRME